MKAIINGKLVTLNGVIENKVLVFNERGGVIMIILSLF